MTALGTLWHYTANTGHVAEIDRDECDQAVIDRLLLIVGAQEGDLSEFGLGIDIMTPLDEQRQRVPGAAFFQIGPAGERMSKTPYVRAVCCWRADQEAEAWKQFRQLVAAHALRRVFERQAPLAEPPDIPWLAVHLQPHALLLPAATLPILGDLARCFAWALIESE